MTEEQVQEFFKYLKCRLELFPLFVGVNRSSPKEIWDEGLFRDEFTFDNWLKGKIGQRKYSTGLSTISNKNASVLTQKYKIDDDVCIQEGFRYSIYRFKKYNFKRIVYINGKKLDEYKVSRLQQNQ